ncbi:MAG: hypothetical protein KFF50_02275, partial [Desulfatitalea sp.]|nr:hypothetical protein [Desulfatitalea sp.]
MAALPLSTEPSLLPYLQPGHSGLRLRLALTEPRPDGAAPPWATIEGAGPFTALAEAAITAGTDGPPLIELLVLVQPDRYPAITSELQPVCNPDVESLWQAAARRKASGSEIPLALWPEQIDAHKQWVPWRPIFQCHYTGRFAHPLCPRCGAGLTLCRNDSHLSKAGLPDFSTSLARFLFCPSCATAAEPPRFYTRTLPADPPDHLLGPQNLIEGFSRLLTREDLANDLPCIGCDQTATCYGPQNAVRQRMAVVSFYPFFMLPYPAPSLNLLDFIALLTGTAVDGVARRLTRQQKPGRLRKLRQCQPQLSTGDGLLFRQPSQHFAEVLYLKLTLLETLFERLSIAGYASGPVADMSLESFWVKLPAHAARLPLFWHFHLQWIDTVGRPGTEPADGPLALGRLRAFLGSAWFYVLLTNDHQEGRNVQAAVDGLVSNPPLPPASTPNPVWEGNPVFAPANLLNHAQPLPLDQDGLTLWHRALNLGLALFQAGRRADPDWSDHTFRKELESLKQAVHNVLFRHPMDRTAVGSTPATGLSQDQQIASIVRSVLARWPQDPAPPEQLDAPAPVPEHPLPHSEGDFLQTVILGAGRPGTEPEPQAPAAAPALEETVLIRGATPNTAESAEPAAPEDDLAATVVLNPGQTDQTPGAATSPTAATEPPATAVPAAPDEATDLEATVLMGGGVAPPSPRTVPSAPPSRPVNPP